MGCGKRVRREWKRWFGAEGCGSGRDGDTQLGWSQTCSVRKEGEGLGEGNEVRKVRASGH